MPMLIGLLKSKRNFLLVSLIWILLWVVHWGKLLPIQENIYLAFFIDLARLGLAVGMFIIPGALLYILVSQSDIGTAGILEVIIVGFSFSVLIIALIGLLGRVLGLSFLAVKSMFALVGLVELMILMVYTNSLDLSKITLESLRGALTTAPLMLALLIATLMTLNGYLFFYDDTTYLAYITNWQFSDQLGFKNIVFEGNFTESARFWLAMYPMGQALLSSLSGVPGILLLTNYLELFLVPGAMLTSYWFAQTLGLSRRASGFAALIQVSLFSWMIWNLWPVGTWFFQSMSEDKVSAVFLLSPVFFVFFLRFIQFPIKNSLLLVLLSGLSLTLTHPVILFFSCAIAFMMGLFSWIFKKANGRVILQFIILFAILILPYILIRFSGGPSQPRIPYDAESASETFQIERYIKAISHVFYGLNPELLKFVDMGIQPDSRGYVAFQLFRLTPILLMTIAGIWSIVNLKRGGLYWYVLACVMLIFFASFPYTGWLLGYFVSARMIARAAWFAPLGLGGILLSKLALDWLKSLAIIDPKSRIRRFNLEIMGLGLCLAFVTPLLLDSIVSQVPLFFRELDRSKQLAQVGAYIDRNTINPVTVIALDYDDTQLLPGVAAHVLLISFREERDYNPHNYFLSVEENRERIAASNTIRSLNPSLPTEKRCMLFDKYNVRFVVVEPVNAELFGSLVDACEKKFVDVFKTQDLALLEYK